MDEGTGLLEVTPAPAAQSLSGPLSLEAQVMVPVIGSLSFGGMNAEEHSRGPPALPVTWGMSLLIGELTSSISLYLLNNNFLKTQTGNLSGSVYKAKTGNHTTSIHSRRRTRFRLEPYERGGVHEYRGRLGPFTPSAMHRQTGQWVLGWGLRGGDGCTGGSGHAETSHHTLHGCS